MIAKTIVWKGVPYPYKFAYYNEEGVATFVLVDEVDGSDEVPAADVDSVTFSDGTTLEKPDL